MSEPALSEEADPLYRPLEGLERWAAVHVDEVAWAAAVDRLEVQRRDDADWAAMVDRGAVLAAAYMSGALDGVHAGDRQVALALLRGEASLATMDDGVRSHVRANVDALALAHDAEVSEATIREIHEVACRPQRTHRVLVEGRAQDHVMAPGDYKHHPNHLLTPSGEWLATAPVAEVRPEMARVVELAGSAQFRALHPATQAGWLHDALLHVQPFADGNGRVARALAGAVLLRATGLPLVVFAKHDQLDVVEAVVDLVELLSSADRSALGAWRARSAAAEELRRQLVPALERELRRRDAHRRADVSGATVDAGLVVVVPGTGVEERIVIDAHPLDDGPVSAAAQEAGLRLVAGDPVEAWVERVVSVLALRVAADME